MPDRYPIVTGQYVSPVKRDLVRDLRRRMTPAERALWDRLRGGQIDGRRFRRQQFIDGFVVDFYCPSAGLVIEVDGSIHETKREYDAERDAVLGGRGLRLIRFPNERVLGDIEGVVAEIRGDLTA